jgi:muramoyltetrapeptide carboxypeptidase
MKRKQFIGSLLPAAFSFQALSAEIKFPEKEFNSSKIPPYLKPGDTIGITAPAGFITLDEIQSAINKMNEWGCNVKVGNTIGKKDFTYGGTDVERLADFQQMLDDNSVKAIMCARGGYGCVRIIDKINFNQFQENPKWIIGFSDITVLHSHINRNYNVATIHSKMCNSFPDDWSNAEQVQIDSIDSIRKCLVGEKIIYTATANANNKKGSVTGELVGGNLRTIENLTGSDSDILTKNKILFLEDTGEYLYSIDRMFWNLKRTGKLEKLKGLIIGGFKAKKDDPGEEFGKTIEEIVLEKITEYDYPVCFDFPVGHQKNNVALKCGVSHILTVNNSETTLTPKK